MDSMNEDVYTADLNKALEIIREGGVILYPTDTIWGIGCDATNSKAIKRVYELKQRCRNKSLIVLVDSIASLERCVGTIPEAAEQLIEAAVYPLTIIYDSAAGVAKEALATDGSIGVRITSERFSRDLCRRLHRPIISTSANISNGITPLNFYQIEKEILDGVDYVVKHNRKQTNLMRPSNIIKVTNSNIIKIIR